MASTHHTREHLLPVKLLTLLLAIALTLIACSGGDEDNALATSTTGDPEQSLDADGEEAESGEGDEEQDSPDSLAFGQSSVDIEDDQDDETTTTGAPDNSTTSSAADVASNTNATESAGSTAAASGAPPIKISTPTCGTLGAANTRTAPFTGEQASIPVDMPAVVVKVSNNSASSRATLIGLDQADIVIEERIEDRATRFFSVFHSSLPANAGPVRSGRTTDVDLALNLNVPVFAYSGANSGIESQLANADNVGNLVLFRNTDSSPFARDSRYSAPDNLFVSPAGLGACSTSNPTPIFSYGANNSTTAQAASSVSFTARSSFRFDWDGSAWVRSQSGTPHVTREGAALAPENVVVLFTPTVYQGIFVIQPSIGSGEAWILRDGTVTQGSYSRANPLDPYTLTDANGTELNLTPGQTWVVLAPEGTASVG